MSEKVTNPAFRQMIAKLGSIDSRIDALINQNMPKDLNFDVWTITKAAAFVDTRVDCIDADLLQISSDGDMTDLSYKIVHLDGGISPLAEAAECPQFPGRIAAILLTNDTAEAGASIRVTRIQGSPVLLAAIMHGTPMSISAAQSGRMFYAEAVEYAPAALNLFEDDEPINGVLPTHFMTGFPLSSHIIIHGVKYQMNPTAAETYQLYLLEGATAEIQQQEAEIIYDSGAGIAGGDIVNWVAGGAPSRLPVMARLTAPGIIWFKLDWSGPPGNTGGYIRVMGETLA